MLRPVWIDIHLLLRAISEVTVPNLDAEKSPRAIESEPKRRPRSNGPGMDSVIVPLLILASR
jgi:hypothetical protein